MMISLQENNGMINMTASQILNMVSFFHTNSTTCINTCPPPRLPSSRAGLLLGAGCKPTDVVSSILQTLEKWYLDPRRKRKKTRRRCHVILLALASQPPLIPRVQSLGKDKAPHGCRTSLGHLEVVTFSGARPRIILPLAYHVTRAHFPRFCPLQFSGLGFMIVMGRPLSFFSLLHA